jgi:hypothetical protein
VALPTSFLPSPSAQPYSALSLACHDMACSACVPQGLLSPRPLLCRVLPSVRPATTWLALPAFHRVFPPLALCSAVFCSQSVLPRRGLLCPRSVGSCLPSPSALPCSALIPSHISLLSMAHAPILLVSTSLIPMWLQLGLLLYLFKYQSNPFSCGRFLQI